MKKACEEEDAAQQQQQEQEQVQEQEQEEGEQHHQKEEKEEEENGNKCGKHAEQELCNAASTSTPCNPEKANALVAVIEPDNPSPATTSTICSSTSPTPSNLMDISEVVNTCACAYLQHDQPMLFRQPRGFNLHDSMAALELMDGSMDCCEVVHKNEEEVSSSQTVMPPPRFRPPRHLFDTRCSDDEDVFYYHANNKNNNKTSTTTLEQDVRMQLLHPPRRSGYPPCPLPPLHAHSPVSKKGGYQPLPWTDLTLHQVTIIACHMLIRQAAVLQGASVAESTYTCMYVHRGVLEDMRRRLHSRPNSIQETTMARQVLYALSLTLVRASDMVRSIVQHADIYEEEDFTVTMHGLEFYIPYHTTDNDNHNHNHNNNHNDNDNGNGKDAGKRVQIQNPAEEEIVVGPHGQPSTPPAEYVRGEVEKALDMLKKAAQERRQGVEAAVSNTTTLGSSCANHANANANANSNASANAHASSSNHSGNANAHPHAKRKKGKKGRNAHHHRHAKKNHQQQQQQQQQLNTTNTNHTTTNNNSNKKGTTNTTLQDEEIHDPMLKNVQVLQHVLYYQMRFIDGCTMLTTLKSDTVLTTVPLAKAYLSEARRHLHELEGLLHLKDASKKTNDKPTSPSSSSSNTTTTTTTSTQTPSPHAKEEVEEEEDYLVALCFDSFANRRLLGNTPVRRVKFRTLAEATCALSDICHQVQYAVCDLILLDENASVVADTAGAGAAVDSPPVLPSDGTPLSTASPLRTVHTYMKHVSAQQCNVLTRSLVVLSLYFDDLLLGRFDLNQAVAHAMISEGVPRHVVMETEYGVVFVQRLGKPLYDSLKMLALNRSRQRSFLEAFVFAEWAALQREANAVDYYHRSEGGGEEGGVPKKAGEIPPHVTNWVFLHTVWIMEHYLCLALELQLLHEEYDLAVAYWYLSFLLSAQHNIMTVMRTEVATANALARRALLLSGGSGKEDMAQRVHQGQQHRVGGDGKGGSTKLEGENVNHKKKGKHQGKKSAGGGGGANQQQHGDGAGAQSTQVDPVESYPSRAMTAVPTPVDDCVDTIRYMIVAIRRSICRGLFQFLMSLRQAKVIPEPPPYTFTSRKRQFEKRFEAFLVVPQPPALTHDDFVRGSDISSLTTPISIDGNEDSDVPQPDHAGDLIASATESFQMAKRMVDRVLLMLTRIPPLYRPLQREEAMGLAKVCVGNSLFLHRLSQRRKEEGLCGGRNGGSTVGKEDQASKNRNMGGVKGSVSFDFSVDKVHCTIKLM